MCEFHRLGRRAFLTDLGRGALAIAVFTPVIGACSSSAGDTEVTPTSPTGSSTAGSSTAGSSIAGSSPTTGPASSTRPATETTKTSEMTETTGLPPATSASSAATPVDAATAITYRRVNLGFVSAYVLVRGNEAAVVDTGVSGSAGAIGEALSAASLDWGAVRHVILTHHHPDHAGSIGDVLTSATNATAYAGEADVDSITAPRALRSVVDGDEVFGLQIVGTPGHTAGHISIYDALGRVLVAGDAINNVDGLTGPNPQFSADMTAARESARRLADLPLETVFFGHGDPIEHGAGPMLVDLARSL